MRGARQSPTGSLANTHLFVRTLGHSGFVRRTLGPLPIAAVDRGLSDGVHYKMSDVEFHWLKALLLAPCSWKKAAGAALWPCGANQTASVYHSTLYHWPSGLWLLAESLPPPGPLPTLCKLQAAFFR